jgi:hypothetical protein
MKSKKNLTISAQAERLPVGRFQKIPILDKASQIRVHVTNTQKQENIIYLIAKTGLNMKAFMIYGITIYDYQGIETSREYFLVRKEREKRLSEVNGHTKEAFNFMLSKSTAWKLNHHGRGKDKQMIKDLKEEIEQLKRKLKARIELVFNNSQ